MSIADQLKAMEKRLDETMDGVLAEQISSNARLDDLDHQLGEVRDLLLQVLAVLEPSEDRGGSRHRETDSTRTSRPTSRAEKTPLYEINQQIKEIKRPAKPQACMRGPV